MADIGVNICGLELKNPVMTAAGPGSRNADLCIKAARGGAGCIVTKTVSSKAADVPRPCMGKVNGGFLNTELWSEMPIEEWVKNEYGEIKNEGLPMIIGMGYTKDQISEIAPMIKPYADAVEISTHYVGTDPGPIVEALKAAKKVLDVPVFMKMSPQADVVTIAKAVEKAGADGLVMINSFGPCMAIDVKTGYPIMGSKAGYGWLSGAAIRPLAVRCIFEASNAVKIPIIGVGGITNGIEAAEMIMAGASAVQLCTEAILKGPSIYGKIAAELNDFLDENGYSDISEIKGLAHKRIEERIFRVSSITPRVDNSKCIKCGTCRVSCVYEAISITDKLYIDKNKCFGCGLCVTRCPKGALSISYK